MEAQRGAQQRYGLSQEGGQFHCERESGAMQLEGCGCQMQVWVSSLGFVSVILGIGYRYREVR